MPIPEYPHQRSQNPSIRQRCDKLAISEKLLNHYGSLEGAIHAIRDHRPLDLNAEQWRATDLAHTDGSASWWIYHVATLIIL